MANNLEDVEAETPKKNSTNSTCFKKNVKLLQSHKIVGGRLGTLRSSGGQVNSLEDIGLIPSKAELDYARPKKVSDLKQTTINS